MQIIILRTCYDWRSVEKIILHTVFSEDNLLLNCEMMSRSDARTYHLVATLSAGYTKVTYNSDTCTSFRKL